MQIRDFPPLPRWTTPKNSRYTQAMRIALSMLCLLAASSASAQSSSMGIVDTGTRTARGYDELIFLGWNNACSVAIQYFSYPPIGEGLEGVPDTWASGTITIEPGSVDVIKNWVDRGITSQAWDRKESTQKTEEMLRTGYAPTGRVEILREAPVADHPSLEHIIHSTAAFRLGYKKTWPPRRFALERIHYSPLGNCAFLIFRSLPNPRDSHRYRLVRLLNPGVRRMRARAHVTNGLLLFKDSDMVGAEEELSIATETDPEYPLALYHHSRLLAAHGRFEEAFEKLIAAIKRDKKYAEKAKNAVEFESVNKRSLFKKITGQKELKIIPQRYEDQYLR
jgi:hypothetical protein